MAQGKTAVRWLPLESNPDVMNKFISKLCGSVSWQCADVFGLDPELLCMVPQPVAALLLLFPLNEKSESSEIGKVDVLDQSGPFFMKQTIGNACGTIGLIHALCNNADRIDMADGSILKKFLSSSLPLTPEKRGELLESNTDFGVAHEESALEGQTQAPDREDKVNLHFIAFVHNDGKLYELDGRKDGPVLHGNTTLDTLLPDAAAVIKKFMERDPENLNFTVVALSQA